MRLRERAFNRCPRHKPIDGQDSNGGRARPSTNKRVQFAGLSPSFGPSVASPNSAFVFGYLVDEAQLLCRELGHASDEPCTLSFVAFEGDALEAFQLIPARRSSSCIVV